MPNSNRRAGQSEDDRRQWQGNQNQEQGENAIDDGDDNVEIGDPVPENDRTVRAQRSGQGLSTGQGETGEDEGLSGDAGDGERH
ncbi:MAG TPA: hypothetical protein VFS47_06235 [Steroidobacteraceae bacterium]|nr:hypothetical protein [Steroidobacteraceae bacterium]